MLDTTNFLIHKLSLQIFRPMQFEDNTTVFDAVKYILLERICETFHLQIEWDTFSRSGKFRSASGAANIQIASYYNKVCNYANLRKRSKPIWKAKERSD